MSNKKTSCKYVTRLFRFMWVFEIDRFQILEVSSNQIRAVVGWPDEGDGCHDTDEEVQEILWDIQEFDNMDESLDLLEFAYSNGLFDFDKFLISEDTLRQKIGWKEDTFELALKTLLSIRVDMLDDGMKSDVFFVHF